MTASRALVEALRAPRAWPGAIGTRARLVETHISWVLLAGEHACKIKKPVDLGFLDFSTLEARHHWCEEELRLNRRLAPSLYLDVVPVTGTPDRPRFGGRGAAIEYAVRMRRFPANALFAKLAGAGRLDARHADDLAGVLARFHATAPAAAPDSGFGAPGGVLAAALDNFAVLRHCHSAASDTRALDELEAWTRDRHRRIAPAVLRRQQQGFVRECHGDLHLGNIVLAGGHPVPFDCIEFNAGLRWIDTMSEAAFVWMDFLAHGRPELANAFLNAYLDATGDYAGLAVLRDFAVYRALVRAKVAALTAAGTTGADRRSARADLRRYLRTARALANPVAPLLVLMHGVSGSGKSTVARGLAPRLGAITLRSDVERKRLLGYAPQYRATAAEMADLYSAARTRQTYRHLERLARAALQADLPVIVDATLLAADVRARFHGLARSLGVPSVLLACAAPADALAARLARRARHNRDASDADVAVLHRQLGSREALDAEDRRRCVPWHGTRGDARNNPPGWDRLAARVRRKAAALSSRG